MYQNNQIKHYSQNIGKSKNDSNRTSCPQKVFYSDKPIFKFEKNNLMFGELCYFFATRNIFYCAKTSHIKILREFVS